MPAEDERVTLDNLIELHLAEQLSIADVANLEREVPGISQAVGAVAERHQRRVAVVGRVTDQSVRGIGGACGRKAS